MLVKWLRITQWYHFYDWIPKYVCVFCIAEIIEPWSPWAAQPFQYWIKLTYQRRHWALMLTLDWGGIYTQQQVNSKDPRQSRSVIRSIKWEAVKGAPCDSRGGKAWDVSYASCHSLTQTQNHGIFMPRLMFIDSASSSVWSPFAALGEIPRSEVGQGEARHAETPPNAKPIVFHSWTITDHPALQKPGVAASCKPVCPVHPQIMRKTSYTQYSLCFPHLVWWGATVWAKMS